MKEIQAIKAKYPDLSIGFISVLQNRSASDYLAKITSIRHESPQFLIFKEKKCIAHWSHFSIQKEKIDWTLQELKLKK